MNSSTRISGAEAPDEIPIVLHFFSLSSGKLLSEWINSASHPLFLATSTSRTELDEFLLPIIKKLSQFLAIFFTAACLLVVA